MTADLETTISMMIVPEFPGWCPADKALHLARLVSDHKPKCVVEIGVFGGRSLIPMALALQENGSGVSYGIDPWELDAALEGSVAHADADWWKNNVDLEEVYRGFVEKIWALRLTKECIPLRMHSERAASLFAAGSIDILHLDSNHSTETSCRDVMTWRHRVRDLLVMDDVNWESQREAIQLLTRTGFREIHKADTWAVYQRS